MLRNTGMYSHVKYVNFCKDKSTQNLEKNVILYCLIGLSLQAYIFHVMFLRRPASSETCL